MMPIYRIKKLLQEMKWTVQVSSIPPAEPRFMIRIPIEGNYPISIRCYSGYEALHLSRKLMEKYPEVFIFENGKLVRVVRDNGEERTYTH